VDVRHDVDYFDDLYEQSPEINDFLKSERLSLSGYNNTINELDEFKKKTYDLARYHVEGFFKNRSLHTGGKVSKILMFNEKRISKVVNYTIIKGVDSAYNAINDSLQGEDDIRLVIDVLREIGTWRHENGSCVPIQFRGGLLCMYLELIEGYDF
jgi:hypothetical protein